MSFVCVNSEIEKDGDSLGCCEPGISELTEGDYDVGVFCKRSTKPDDANFAGAIGLDEGLINCGIVECGGDVERPISDSNIRLVEIDLEERGCLERSEVVVAHDVVGIGVEYIVF